MPETVFDLGRLALLGLIAVIVLAVLGLFAISAIGDIFTSYQDERLELIDAQADADAASARQAEEWAGCPQTIQGGLPICRRWYHRMVAVR